jgi:hypothetical protein
VNLDGDSDIDIVATNAVQLVLHACLNNGMQLYLYSMALVIFIKGGDWMVRIKMWH